MRNLASVRKIADIKPIPKADRIELAIVDGWCCVVKKDVFKVGDLAVYIEIDSIVPDHEIFEFMRERKFRVRTIKLRKQISQGLLIELEDLDRFKTDLSHKVLEGDDVTEVMSIVKHDPEAHKEKKYNQKQGKPLHPVTAYLMSFNWFRRLRYFLGFKRLRNFPEFLSKTDETRVQNLPRVGEIYKDVKVYSMEKLDGSSASYSLYGKRIKKNFYVCSRNLSLHKPNDSIWWKVAKDLNIEYKLKVVGKIFVCKNIAIQGEIIGEGIQGNKYGLKGIDFYIFNIINLDTNYYLNLEEKLDFCKRFGFKHMPVLETFTISEDMNTGCFVNLADGKSVINDTILREGVVFRSVTEDRQSFKAISNLFLLKYGD